MIIDSHMHAGALGFPFDLDYSIEDLARNFAEQQLAARVVFCHDNVLTWEVLQRIPHAAGLCWVHPHERGWLAATEKFLDAATDPHFAKALRLHLTAQRPFDRARTELLYGESLRRRRERLQAREHLRAALDLFERLGAHPWAGRARAELRASGETARPRMPGPTEQLTSQELQVARFITAGASTRRAASQIFHTPRTNDAHLRSIYAKLGITSRAELRVADLGEIPQDAAQ